LKKERENIRFDFTAEGHLTFSMRARGRRGMYREENAQSTIPFRMAVGKRKKRRGGKRGCSLRNSSDDDQRSIKGE